MSFGNHGGYENDDGQDRPQKEILFRPETMREILGNAARNGTHDLGPELMASINSTRPGPPPQQPGSRQNSFRQSPPRSSSSRQNSFGVNPQYTPPREAPNNDIATFRDAEGNRVQTWNRDEEPGLRVHNYDPEWNDSQPKAPSRTNTGHAVYRTPSGDYVQEYTGSGNLPVGTHYSDSPPPSEGRRSPPISCSRDREGNLVQHYSGDSDQLPLRVHGWPEEDVPTKPQAQRQNSGRY